MTKPKRFPVEKQLAKFGHQLPLKKSKKSKHSHHANSDEETDSDEYIKYVKPTVEPIPAGFSIPDGFFPINASDITDKAQDALASNPSLRLGINCCMYCAAKSPLKPLTCPTCERIEYCSVEHMRKDKQTHIRICPGLCQLDADEDFDTTIGPQQIYPVVKSLLNAEKICSTLRPREWRWQNILFKAIENEMLVDQTHKTPAALRAITKYSSCPLTVARAIMGNNSLLVKAARAFVPHKESISADTDYDTILEMQQNAVEYAALQPSTDKNQSFSMDLLGKLTLHIVGASALECTSEALVFWNILPLLLAAKMNLPYVASTASTEPVLWKIRLVFIGLELPKTLKRGLPGSDLELSPHLELSFFDGTYDVFINSLEKEKVNEKLYTQKVTLNSQAEDKLTPFTVFNSQTVKCRGEGEVNHITGDDLTYLDAFPDFIVGFQLGLTVKEYNWSDTLATFRGISKTARYRLLEKYLKSNVFSKGGSNGVADALQVSLVCKDDQEELRKIFVITTSSSKEEAFTDSRIYTCNYGLEDLSKAKRNPLSSLKVLQSGTLGNDIWYKNAYMSIYSTPTLF